MKLVTFRHDGAVRPGLIMDDAVMDLASALQSLGLGSNASMIDIIAGGEAVMAGLRSLVAAADGAMSLPLSSVTLLAPIPRPAKNVFCVGRNYVEHVSEASAARGREMKLPAAPQYFTKPPTAVIGPYADVPLHADLTRNLDYEVELAVVIGKGGVNIARDDVFDHIFGYTVINDVTARELQKQHDQWFKGKGLDGSCPMGPWIVTADELRDPQGVDLSLKVNGELRQNSNTRYMIFDIREIVSVLSQGLTLEPGDVIATGTPSGVGFAMNPPHLLQDGDVMEATVEGVGTIRNTVRAKPVRQ